MNPWTLLYGVTILILVGTLIVWVVQYRRMYPRNRPGESGPGTSGDDTEPRGPDEPLD